MANGRAPTWHLPEWNSGIMPLIGMLHLPPLPGSPRNKESLKSIVGYTLLQAERYVESNLDTGEKWVFNAWPYPIA